MCGNSTMFNFLVARLKNCFRYQKLVFFKVIGDKKGGKTSKIFANNDSMKTLEEIAEVVKLPMKFIHVTRNPFDNIATMTLRLASQRNNVREEGIKVIFVPCRGIQDSLVFWIPRRGYPDSRYWIPVCQWNLDFWIPIASGIPDPLSCFPDSKAQDSGLHKQSFLIRLGQSCSG